MWKHKNFINVQLHAPGPHDCTVYFDNNIISVTCTGDYGDSDTWTESGTTMNITSGSTDIQYFTVILKEGYVLDSITYTESSQLQLNDVTDNSFNISGDYGQLDMVTLTSKQIPKVNYIISDTELTAIADATRAKADITTKLTPAQIAEKINNLTIVANIDTADKMSALLVAENDGNVYKYVGTTTSDYINGDLYVVEEAPSTGNVIKAGTYLFNEELTGVSSGNNLDLDFVAKGNSLTADNVYGDIVNIEHILVQGSGFLSLFNTNNGEASWNLVEWVYNDSEEEYVVSDNIKLRTIIVETDQVVTDEFYSWFNTNTTKQ